MIPFSRISIVASFCLGFLGLAAADAMDMKKDMTAEILSSYVNVSSALANDDLAGAKAAASTVAKHAEMGEQKDVAVSAQKIAIAADIEKARSAFKALSRTVEPLAKDQKGLVVMHCSMANADWVQAKGKTQNPYFGQAMLGCGSPKTSE